MIYLTGRKEFEIKPGKNAVTLGKFDGIHRGHQKLMQTLLRLKEQGDSAGVFTFDFHALSMLKHRKVRQLMTGQERETFLENLGIDWMVEYPFDEEMMETEPEAFIRDTLVGKLHARDVVVGEDYRFGKNRRGSCGMLKQYAEQYGYQVHVLEKEKDETGREISSTYIREELEQGHMEKVWELLGYPYEIHGTVQHGLGLAKNLGFPTMNQIPEEEKMLPPYGVYIVRAQVDGIWYNGITNIGKKPTVHKQDRPWVETYLWDYTGDAYGKEVTVAIYRFCRPERVFSGIEELKEQMSRDVRTGQSYFE